MPSENTEKKVSVHDNPAAAQEIKKALRSIIWIKYQIKLVF